MSGPSSLDRRAVVDYAHQVKSARAAAHAYSIGVSTVLQWARDQGRPCLGHGRPTSRSDLDAYLPTIRVASDVLDAVDRIAAETGESRSEVVRIALDEWLSAREAQSP